MRGRREGDEGERLGEERVREVRGERKGEERVREVRGDGRRREGGGWREIERRVKYSPL